MSSPYWAWNRVLVLAFCLILLIGCAQEPEAALPKPEEIILWDCIQPQYFGVQPYSQKRDAVIKAYEETSGIKVILEEVSREQILEYLGQTDPNEGPDIVFSTEWPVSVSWLNPIESTVQDWPYLDIAKDYWAKEELFLAHPSYVCWLGTASRGSGEPVGYFLESPAFLPGCVGGEIENEDMFEDALVFAKSRYGAAPDNPLTSWKQGDLNGLFPVMPQLLKWLRLQSEEDTVFRPIPNTKGEERFLYTVPAYLVVTDDAPVREAAIPLSYELARSLGRWAARTFYAVPAHMDDISIFQLESGFSQEERSELLSALDYALPVRNISPDQETLDLIYDYLKGFLDDGELESRILSLPKTHTNP